MAYAPTLAGDKIVPEPTPDVTTSSSGDLDAGAGNDGTTLIAAGDASTERTIAEAETTAGSAAEEAPLTDTIESTPATVNSSAGAPETAPNENGTTQAELSSTTAKHITGAASTAAQQTSTYLKQENSTATGQQSSDVTTTSAIITTTTTSLPVD